VHQYILYYLVALAICLAWTVPALQARIREVAAGDGLPAWLRARNSQAEPSLSAYWRNSARCEVNTMEGLIAISLRSSTIPGVLNLRTDGRPGGRRMWSAPGEFGIGGFRSRSIP